MNTPSYPHSTGSVCHRSSLHSKCNPAARYPCQIQSYGSLIIYVRRTINRSGVNLSIQLHIFPLRKAAPNSHLRDNRASYTPFHLALSQKLTSKTSPQKKNAAHDYIPCNLKTATMVVFKKDIGWQGRHFMRRSLGYLCATSLV